MANPDDKKIISKLLKEILKDFENIPAIDLEYYRDEKKPKIRIQMYPTAEPKPLFIGGDIFRCTQNFAVFYKIAERAAESNSPTANLNNPELFLEEISDYLTENLPENFGGGKHLEDFKAISSPVLYSREENGDFEEYIIEFSLIYKKFE
jgi:hypothetical protein